MLSCVCIIRIQTEPRPHDRSCQTSIQARYEVRSDSVFVVAEKPLTSFSSEFGLFLIFRLLFVVLLAGPSKRLKGFDMASQREEHHAQVTFTVPDLPRF